MNRNIVIEQTGSDDFLDRIGTIIEEKLKIFLCNDTRDNEEEKLLTIDETAKLLKVCRTSLYNYEKLGLLKPVRAGKTTRYLKSDVINYFKRQNDE